MKPCHVMDNTCRKTELKLEKISPCPKEENVQKTLNLDVGLDLRLP
jgi:hypothetical protein